MCIENIVENEPRHYTISFKETDRLLFLEMVKKTDEAKEEGGFKMLYREIRKIEFEDNTYYILEAVYRK